MNLGQSGFVPTGGSSSRALGAGRAGPRALSPRGSPSASEVGCQGGRALGVPGGTANGKGVLVESAERLETTGRPTEAGGEQAGSSIPGARGARGPPGPPGSVPSAGRRAAGRGGHAGRRGLRSVLKRPRRGAALPPPGLCEHKWRPGDWTLPASAELSPGHPLLTSHPPLLATLPPCSRFPHGRCPAERWPR